MVSATRSSSLDWRGLSSVPRWCRQTSRCPPSKRARYAAELVQPIVGEPAERFVARTRKLQDILGEYQDAVVAEERLRTLVAEDRRSPAALLANKLVKRQRLRRQAAQLDFFEQW